MTITSESALKSRGLCLDTAENSFGELRDSSSLVGNGEALRSRMQEEGYLFVRGFFKREDVLAARSVVVQRAAEHGLLRSGTDPMDAIINEESTSSFRPDFAEANRPLEELLYGEHLLGFYREFFDEPVRHYDFTWLRAMSPGQGTQPHCDVVYMGRGTREKLLTAWVPLGDAPTRLGGLMILEGSHLQHEKLRRYLNRDVDSYCTNGRFASEIEAGDRSWEWNGILSRDPVSLRQKLGGRWLTTDFEAGDLLTFTMHTVHASTDNQTEDRIRFSSDSRYQPASLPADERWIGEKPIGHGRAGKLGRIC